MPTTGDLIALNSLVLTDTFNTWLNRTNELVGKINPLQVYDLDVGVGSVSTLTSGGGLAKYTGGGAVYNGLITVGVNSGPGIEIQDLSGQSRVVLDFKSFDDYSRVLAGTGGSASPARVASTDEYIVNDVSAPGVGGEGTAKKVQARYMLPPEVAMDTLTISGDVVIKGNLSTFGAFDVIASNNLRIEDKQVEIAFQQSVILGLTGVTSGSFPLTGGQTTYYFVNNSTTTPYLFGRLVSYTGAAAGPTGQFVLGALFQNPYGAEDVGATGYLSLSSTGSPRYLFDTNFGVTSQFLNNENLDEAGIVVKGLSTDKSFLWIWTDNDTGRVYDSFQASTNLGVDGSTNAIISRVYRSFGFTGSDQSEFIFTAESGKNAEIILTETNSTVTPLNFTGGSWKITKQNATNYLIFSSATAGAGVTPSGFTTSFLITPGASGATYSGVSVNNWAQFLNADMVDGAHAGTTSTPFRIPVAGYDGKIDPSFLGSVEAIRRTYTQTNHGLTFGQAVRFDVTTAGFTSAVATDPEKAEAVGIVSGVSGPNFFTVTHQGRIEGISGGFMTLEGVSFTAGEVYFLGASSAAASRGKLIYDPDNTTATRLALGQVRKPMLLALSATQGYVMDSPGFSVTTPTDVVYLEGLVPVGTIQAYSGRINSIPENWLICDGDRYRAVEYPDLYSVIGNLTYTAKIRFTAQTTAYSGSITGVMEYGTRRLQVGDTVRINFNLGPIDSANPYIITAVNPTTGAITFALPAPVTIVGTAGTGVDFDIAAVVDSSNEAIFFVPDLRSRTIVGSSTGSSDFTTVTNSNSRSLRTAGEFGGQDSSQLTAAHFLNHTHPTTVFNNAELTATASGGYSVMLSPIGSVNANTVVAASNPVNIINPYLTTLYIIRAKPSAGAVLLTGHNHDAWYHPLHGDMQVTAYTPNPFDPIPTNAFNVIATTGFVAGKKLTPILSVFGGLTPSQSFGSNTEVFVNGDFTVFANGMTAPGVGTTGRYGTALIVRPNISTVSIVGGTGSRFVDGTSGDVRPAPVLAFVNGAVGGPPIGRITGLTSPTNNDDGSNKFYSDTSNKRVPFSVNNTNKWGVYHDLSTVARAGTQTAMMEVYYDNNQGSTSSRIGTSLYGDFKVFPDGCTSISNRTGDTFLPAAFVSVETHVGKFKLQGSTGGFTKPGNFPPRLQFLTIGTRSDEFNRDTYGAAGNIDGLTAPRYDHNAANRWYVDQTTTDETVLMWKRALKSSVDDPGVTGMPVVPGTTTQYLTDSEATWTPTDVHDFRWAAPGGTDGALSTDVTIASRRYGWYYSGTTPYSNARLPTTNPTGLDGSLDIRRPPHPNPSITIDSNLAERDPLVFGKPFDQIGWFRRASSSDYYNYTRENIGATSDFLYRGFVLQPGRYRIRYEQTLNNLLQNDHIWQTRAKLYNVLFTDFYQTTSFPSIIPRQEDYWNYESVWNKVNINNEWITTATVVEYDAHIPRHVLTGVDAPPQGALLKTEIRIAPGPSLTASYNTGVSFHHSTFGYSATESNNYRSLMRWSINSPIARLTVTRLGTSSTNRYNAGYPIN